MKGLIQGARYTIYEQVLIWTKEGNSEQAWAVKLDIKKDTLEQSWVMCFDLGWIGLVGPDWAQRVGLDHKCSSCLDLPLVALN